MVAVSSNQRSRLSAPAGRARNRHLGRWLLALIPVCLVGLFVWQLVSPLLRSEVAGRTPASIGRVTLDADPSGTRVSVVVLDRNGQDLAADGTLSVRLREPDGAVWEGSRAVSAADFAPLPSGQLLAGRLGYSMVVPSSAWVRPPRTGGTASVSVTLAPAAGGPAISATEAARFP